MANAILSEPLWIGNLPYDTQADELWRLCGTFGLVENIELFRDPKTGRSMGWVFCHYVDYDSASVAKAILAGIPYGGRTLAVEWAANRSRSGGGGGAGGPGASTNKPPLRAAGGTAVDVASLTFNEFSQICCSISHHLNANPQHKEALVKNRPEAWKAFVACQAASAAAFPKSD